MSPAEVRLEVTDAEGSSAVDVVTVEVPDAPDPDNAAPTCALTAPTDGGASVPGEGVDLAATVGDPDGEATQLVVQWTSDLDGLIGASTPGSDGLVVASTNTLSRGQHQLSVVATDPQGGSCTDSVTWTVDAAPTITLLLPEEGALFETGSSVTMAVEVGDPDDLSEDLRVTFESDLDGVVYEANATWEGDLSVTTRGLSVGTHSLTMTVTDPMGLRASVSTTLTVDGPSSAPAECGPVHRTAEIPGRRVHRPGRFGRVPAPPPEASMLLRARPVLVFGLLLSPVVFAARNAVSDDFPVYENDGLPDLTLDPVRFENQMQIIDRVFAEDDCAIVEGSVGGAGARRLLRFDTVVMNMGDGDLVIGDRSDPANPYAEQFELDTCHGHYHFQGFSSYDLLTPDGSLVVTGHKQGFCFEDSFKYSGNRSSGYNCEYQGITSGWGDWYYKQLGGQWIDITGVPEGDYIVRVTIDATEVFDEGEDRYPNQAEVTIHVPDPRNKVDGE